MLIVNPSAAESTHAYRRNRLLTSYGEGSGPTILVWHGRGAYERDVLAPLARRVASSGRTVFVPDWDPGSADLGRGDLIASVEYASSHRRRDDSVVLVGWSLGGAAALGFAADGRFAPLLSAVVGLAVDLRGRDRLSGQRAEQRMLDAAPFPGPVRLIHGTADVVVPAGQSDRGVDRARARGWDVERRLVDTDHAGIVGAEYDPGIRRCREASTAPAVRGLAAAVAAIMAVTH